MAKMTVILPAYNEEQNMEMMVARWQEFRGVLLDIYGVDLQIIAVNDGSRDQTGQIAQRLTTEYDNFVLVNHPHNKGLGEAVKTGIQYFLGQDPKSAYMCLMDCDNTQDPIYITDMIDCMNRENADVVIASRYQRGSEVKGVSDFRLLMSGGAKYVFSLLLHVPRVKDYTCGYRLYSEEILRRANTKFGENLVEESGFTCMVELLYKLYTCGATFAEIPFSLRYDFKKGASKMSVFKTAANSILLALRLKRIKR